MRTEEQMKITLFMAMSVNGIIARENGSEDFLSDENWQTFSSLVEEFGNFIVGSKTYEAVKEWDEDYGFDDFVSATKVVVSDDPKYQLDDSYLLATSPQNAIETMQQREFDKVLLIGGSTNNTSFAKLRLIDEVILNIEPVLLGKGIPIFRFSEFQLDLDFVESKAVSNGIVQLQYKVRK